MGRGVPSPGDYGIWGICRKPPSAWSGSEARSAYFEGHRTILFAPIIMPMLWFRQTMFHVTFSGRGLRQRFGCYCPPPPQSRTAPHQVAVRTTIGHKQDGVRGTEVPQDWTVALVSDGALKFIDVENINLQIKKTEKNMFYIYAEIKKTRVYRDKTTEEWIAQFR